jgi:hypothetical protein
MNAAQLKELLQHVPDDTPVVILTPGWVEDLDLVQATDSAVELSSMVINIAGAGEESA